MADINEILGRQINSVKELKTAIKELQDSLVGVDAESEEFKTTTQQLSAAQEELNKVTRAGKTDTDAAKDSLVGMRQEYKALYDQYKLLSEEQRKTDFGKAMADSLEKLSNKINDTQKGIGDFRGNVGRYAQSITDAFNGMGISLGALQTPLKLATGGANTFGKALKTLAANPIVLIITGLVAILVKAAAAIKQNEELTNRLREAMSVFRPVLDAVSNAFDFLAGIIVKVVEGLSKVAEKIMSIIPGMKQAIQSHKDLAKATNDLTKAQRENSVVASQKQAEIERLREEASATEDVAEKRRLLEEAKAMQAEVDQREIELAQEELRILQEYGEKTANAAEENEKLAAAQKKVNDLIAQGERNQRMYNKQLDATTKKTTSATSSAKNYREEAKKLHEQLIEDNKTEITKLTEKYEKEKKLLEKYHLDTSLLTKKYQKDIAEIRQKEWKREQESYKAAYDSWTDDLARWYENQKQLARTNSEAIFVDEKKLKDGLERLQEFKTETDNLVAGAQDGLGRLMKTVFERVDLSKITDFDYVKDTVLRYTEEGKEEVMYIFGEMGEEGWTAFVQGIEDETKVLNTTFGLNIKHGTDLEARATQLGKDIAQKYGEGFEESLEEWRTDNLSAIYDKIAHVLMEDSSQEAMNATRQFIARNEYRLLDEEKTAIEAELDVFSGTTEQKLSIMQRYYEVVDELRERERELADLEQQRTEEMFESLIDLSDRMTGALSTYRSSQEQLIESQLKAGQIDEQEANKKKKRLLNLQRVERDFSIATITADAAAGIFSVWRGYATEVGQINPQTAKATGVAGVGTLAALNAKSLISAIAKTASLATTAAAQIAAAQNGYVSAKNNFSAESGGGSSSSAGVGATPVVVDSTPYTYTRTIQTQDEKDELNRPIVCSVVDIEDALEVRKVRIEEASF